MMTQAFRIDGRLPSWNEYEHACRAHWGQGYRVKKHAIQQVVDSAYGLKPVDGPVEIAVMWVEGKAVNGAMRDVDNVRSGVKYILDGLVRAGVLPDDNPKWVRRVIDNFRFNANDPHIEVQIEPYRHETRTVTYMPVYGVED